VETTLHGVAPGARAEPSRETAVHFIGMSSASGSDSAQALVELVASCARGKETGLFGPDTVMWRVARENVLLAGGPRALLMQLAHPSVMSGVAQHSQVASDALGRSLRTFHAMYTLTFGDLDSALRVVKTVSRRHASVVGSVTSETRSPLAGAPYRAMDPSLLSWVWATLHDTMVKMYETFVRPLTTDERARFYEEGKVLQLAFGIPASAIPPTARAHDDYVENMLRGPLLDVSREARAEWALLARQPPSTGIVGALMLPQGKAVELLLDGLPARLLAPPALGLLAAATLPPSLREAYGLRWTRPDAVAFALLTQAARRSVPHLPRVVRYHAAYRRALARAQSATTAASGERRKERT
jgi:uncharacterized protein (DUF2236 family)